MSDLKSALEKWGEENGDAVPSQPAETQEPEVKTEAKEPVKEDIDWKKEVAAFKQGLLDERAKRQELEIRLARAEGRAEVTQKPKQEEEEEDDEDFWVNPKEYAKSRSERSSRKAVEEYAKAEWAARVEWSQEEMREEHPDYDEKEAAFFKLAEKDESLKAKVRRSMHPAKYVYKHMKKYEESSAFDPEKERERIRKEEREALAKEAGSNEPKKKSTTLAGEQSA
jgi:hypothetical protein